MKMASPHYNEDRLSQYFHGAWESRHEERYYSFGPNHDYRDEVLRIASFQAQMVLDGVMDLASPYSTERAKRLYRQAIDAHSADSKTEKEKDIAWALPEIIDDSLGVFVIEAQAKAENRIHDLIGFMQTHPVSKPTKRYLRRITECYLFGFDEQCIIMCRSALESALMQFIPNDKCEKHMPKEGFAHYSLNDRIEVAEKLGLFPCEFFEIVRYIKNTANDLIHPDRYKSVTVTDDVVRDILMKTVVCISFLEGDNNHG